MKAWCINAYGKTWLGHGHTQKWVNVMWKSTGRREVGTVCASDAEKIILFIANKCGINITVQNPIVMVDLPSARARFTGVLPPITDSPTFGIRKMRADG